VTKEKGNTNQSSARRILKNFQAGPASPEWRAIGSTLRELIQAVVFQQPKDKPNQFSGS